MWPLIIIMVSVISEAKIPTELKVLYRNYTVLLALESEI